jgi:hypothetical protein
MWDPCFRVEVSRRAARRCALRSIALVLLAGCGAPGRYPETISAPDPLVRVKAIIHAGQTKDEKVVPLLVDRLEDEDEGVRFYAILALERIVGTRMGYDYGAPMSARQEAVVRWRDHLATSRTPAASDGDRPPETE